MVPQSTDSIQDYTVNVTPLINRMLQNPDFFHGFMLQMMDEEPYRCLMFASSDNEDSTLRPKLTITYHFETGGNLIYTVEGLFVSFFDNTPGAFAWQWDFGDGTTSELQNQVHEFPGYGAYTVCCAVTTSHGTSTICDLINLQQTGMGDSGEKGIIIYPNPCRDMVNIEIPGGGTLQYNIINLSGMNIKSGELETEGMTYRLVTGDMPSGIYFLVLRVGKVTNTLKLVVVH
jgi:hypothetical protein